jgi:hypothetical protein
MMKDGPRERIVFWVNAHGYDLLKAHAPETGEEYHRQFMAATHSNGLMERYNYPRLILENGGLRYAK